MIGELMLDTALTLLYSFFDLVNVVTLPYDLLTVFYDFCSYGAFVMGGDLLLICFANICAWIHARLTIGVFLFIWRLLPFT